MPKVPQEAVEADALIEETIAAVRMSATKLQVGGVRPWEWDSNQTESDLVSSQRSANFFIVAGQAPAVP